jgi:hypothetical protein
MSLNYYMCLTEHCLAKYSETVSDSMFDSWPADQASSMLRESFSNFCHPDLNQCYLTNTFRLLGLHSAQLSGKVLINTLW